MLDSKDIHSDIFKIGMIKNNQLTCELNRLSHNPIGYLADNNSARIICLALKGTFWYGKTIISYIDSVVTCKAKETR